MPLFDPVSLGLSLAGGLFARKPRYDPNQRLQMEVARQLQQYAGGVPGSDPGEQAALAQERGLLGQQQAQQRNALLAAMPQFAQGATGDLLTNLGVQQQGQLMSLDLAHLADALNRRKQALLDAANVAHGVGPREAPQNRVGEALGALAFQYGQQRAMRQPGQVREIPGAGTTTPGGGAAGPFGFGGGLPGAEPGPVDLGPGMEPAAAGPIPAMESNPLLGAGAVSSWQQLLARQRGEPPTGLYDIGHFTAATPAPARRPRRRR